MNPPSSKKSSKEKFRILIVDDDRIICHLHLNQIRKTNINCEILSLHDGEQALDYLDSEQGNADFLILLDLNMPVMNGWDFLDRLQERNYKNNIFIIVVTSSTIKADLFRAMSYENVINFFEKPLAFEDVLELMETKQIRHYFPSH